MPTGTVTVESSSQVVREKLRGFLAASNSEITQSNDHSLTFRHGTYLTQTATLFPKTCHLRFEERGDCTIVNYEVHTELFVSIWLTVMAILLCWTIFIPIVVYRTLDHHPKRFVENLLAGI